MRIRTRLAVAAIVVAVPQIAALAVWDAWSRQATAQSVLGHMVERAVGEDGAAGRCAEDPIAWATGSAIDRPGGPGPDGDRGGPPDRDGGSPPGPPPSGPRVDPPTMWVYAADGGAWDPGAPDLGLDPTTLDVGLVVPRPQHLFTSELVVATRTGWGDPCAVVAVRGTTTRGFLGGILPTSPVWWAPMLLVATVMWIAVFPTVRRLRRLTEAVRAGEAHVALEGDDEIGELSRAFDAASEALRDEVAARVAREEALRTFVADTAHDVRTPLTVLRGHLTALEGGHDPEALSHALVETHYLADLLDNLAAHARMEAPTETTTIDLGDLVERVAARHRPLARRRGLALEHGVPEAPVLVRGELTLVERALSNLVDNAVRHHDEGGHVAVTLDVEDGRFQLVVQDDGPGLPARVRERLLQARAERDPVRGRDTPGSGRGMGIVVAIVARHRWRLSLDDADGGGLIATIEGVVGA